MDDKQRNSLESILNDGLQCTLRIAWVQGDFEPPSLSDSEQRNLDAFTNDKRRCSWLRARCALKRLLVAAGENSDTTRLTFPHKFYSLTHTTDTAVAVELVDKERGDGIGVDLERLRPVKEGIEKFFLNQNELDTINALEKGARQQALIRMWTIKEAIFKSDFAGQDTILRNYRVGVDNGRTGVATHTNTQRSFRYACVELENHWLTVALPVV
jgi:phosphopantetheinyl transferase